MNRRLPSSLTQQPRRPIVEESEPRVLYSAELMPIGLIAVDQAPEQVDAGAQIASMDHNPGFEQAFVRHELVFIDGSSSAESEYAEALQGAAFERADIEVVAIEPTEVSLDRVRETLASYTELDAVHLTVGYADGAVTLGGQSVDALALGGDQEQIAEWARALKSDAGVVVHQLEADDAAAQQATADFVQAFGETIGIRVELSGAGDAGEATDSQIGIAAIGRELIIVDSAVPNADSLVATLRAEATPGREFDVLLIDAEQDGFAQIDRYLQSADRDGAQWDAWHLITHGSAGAVAVGNATLDSTALVTQADELSRWAQAIAPGGDLLIYGCDVAGTAEGEAFVVALGQVTGANIAASDDETGSSAFDADFELEFQSGLVDTAIAVSQSAQRDFQGTLATFTVTTTAGDNSAGSLNWAIGQANSNAGADRIEFNIADPLVDGRHTIRLSAALPTITDRVTIAGATDSDYSTKPVIHIDASDLVYGHGVAISGGSADGTEIDALMITNAWNSGILVASSDVVITRNFIGTDGVTELPNRSDGIYIVSGADNTVVGGVGLGNLISGNTKRGILTAGDGTIIQGNHIGLNAAGDTGMGNHYLGILVESNAANTIIGGTGAGMGNVVSDSRYGQILLDDGASGSVVQGNYLGTDVTGTFSVSNVNAGAGSYGVKMFDGATGSLIGGDSEAARNIIAGNRANGVHLESAATQNNVVQGNWIGLNVAGDPLGNSSRGVYINNGASNNLIGGTTEGTRNVISTSGTGNGRDGILVEGANTGNAFLGNVITGSGGLGIDLNDDGVSSNDALDVDTGPNDLQNYPVLDLAYSAGGNTYVEGSLHSAALTDYRIEFFRGVTADSSGHGEGDVYLGAISVTTDALGDAAILTSFTGVALNEGDYVTATATVDLGGGSYGSTSEFSGNAHYDQNHVPWFVGEEEIANGQFDDGTASWDYTGGGQSVNDAFSLSTIDFGGEESSEQYLHQLIDTVPGKTYLLRFDYSDDSASRVQTLEVSAAGSVELLATGEIVSGAGTEVSSHYYTFVADDVATLIRFTDTSYISPTADGTIGVTGILDNISVTLANDEVGSSAFTEGGTPAVLATDAILFDKDLVEADNFDTSSLTMMRNGGAQDEDVFGATGLLEPLIEGGDLEYDSTVVGTVVANSSGVLTLAFNGNADTATVNSVLQSITYANTSDTPPGSVQIDLTFSDGNTGDQGVGGEFTASAHVDVAITAVNDAPVNTVPVSAMVTEETATAIAGVSIADLDDLGSSLTTRLEVSEGVLNVTLSGSATISSGALGSGDLTIEGSKADLNATLTSLTYTGNTDVTGVEVDTLTVTTNDQSNTGTGGAQQDVDTIKITVSAVNDAPVNTVPVTATGAEEAIIPIGGISIADVDDLGADMTTRLQVTAGVLNVTLSGSAVISAGSVGTTDLTIQGSRTDINATLATLTYTGDTDVTGLPADTLTVTTNDLGNTGSGGAEEDGDTVSIIITAVNDAPVLSNLNGAAIYIEDGPSVVLEASASVVDPELDALNGGLGNYSGAELTLKASSTSFLGTIYSFVDGDGISLVGDQLLKNGQSIGEFDTTSVGGGLSIVFTSANGETPTSADVNNIMRRIAYANSSQTPPLSAPILWTFNDHNSVLQGTGGAKSVAVASSVSLVASNDAPQNDMPVSATVLEETTTLLTGLDASDADAESSDITVRLQVTAGVLNVTPDGSLVIQSGANDSADLTLFGSQAEIGNTLLTLRYTGNTDVVGTAADTLTMTTNDLGSTGLGGAKQTISTMPINITAVNDAPTNTVPLSATVVEETATPIAGISIADVDDQGANLTTQLQVSSGVVNVTLSGAATISAGANDSANLTISGTLTDINATLASLTYTGDTDVVGASADSLTVTTDDQGNGGLGGALQDIDSVQIDITGVNDAPVNAAPATATVIEETGSAIAGVSIADVDDEGGNLTTRLQVGEGILNVTLSGAATISAGADGSDDLTILGSKADINATLASLTYTGNTDVAGTAADTLTITTDDLGNSGDGGALDDVDTVQIDITAVNDAPVNTVPPTVTAIEETTTAIPGISIADVDGDGSDVTVQLEVSAGVLDLVLSGGATVTAGANGSNDLTLTGSLADINDTLASLTYTGNADVNGVSADTLTVTTDDGGAGGTGGAKQDIDTVLIDITAVNDAPVNTVPVTATVVEETASAIAGISIADVDDAGGNLTTRLQVNDGVLNVTLSGAATISAGADGSDDLTILGSKADINATLASLTYTGNTDVTGSAADTLTITTDDLGNSGTGGALQSSDTVQIDVNGVNDAPANTSPATVTVAEETATAIAGISIADVDAAGADVSTRLQVSNGSLNVTLSGAATISAGANDSGDLTLLGSLVDINATLASLTYTGDTDVTGTAADTLTITTDDLGNTGSGGALSDIDTVLIDITEVNDAPVNNGPVRATVAEETAATIGGISIADVDDQGADLTTRLQVSAGVLNVTLSGAATILAGSDGSADLTIQGSKADINATLATLTYTGNTDVTGTAPDALTVTTNDLGNTGSGGAQEDIDTVLIDVSGVNDAPVNTVPGSASVLEETATVIAGISIADVDDAGGNLTTRLQVNNGVLSVTLAGAATISSGTNGSADLTIEGSKADINATLASLSYTGNTDVTGIEADTLTVTTNDQGNSGSGGALEDVDSVKITINAVNDAPVNTVPATATVVEETATSIAGISIADVDDAGGDMTTRLQVASGTLNVTLSGSATISAGSNGSADLTIEGSKADINATLASLTYTGNTDLAGTAADTLTVTTDDQGNTGDEGAKQDVDAVQIDITGVNDAPVNTVPVSATVAEETATAIAGISIADVDDAGGNMTTQLQVSFGTLNVTLSGSATISAGSNDAADLMVQGSKADINATLASLVYTGNTDVNGTAADSLTVTTSDLGNTGDGGAQEDVDTVQIDITAVNDAPVNTVPASVTADEETTKAIPGISIADVDDDGSDITVQLEVTAGVLDLILSGGVTVTAGANGSNDLTLTGSLDDINDTLASLTYTGNPDVNGIAADTLTITTDDGGAGGQDIDTVQIDITAVNDAPANTVPATATVVEETATAVPGISIADADDAGSNLMTRLQVNDGVLNVTLSGAATISAGAIGSDDLTILGSKVDINATLASLTYTGNTDVTGTAADTLSITTDDLGNSGSGGAQQSTDTVLIDVTAVNDAPVNTVPASVTADEETTTAIPSISIADVDDDGSDITVQLEVTAGVLDLVLSGGATVTAGANGSNELTLTGSLDDINATLASLTYTGNADVNGIAADTLTITTDDGGAGGTGGAQQDIDTIQIDITAMNDAPVNTVPPTVTVDEETTTAIPGLSIADVDAAGADVNTRLQVSNGSLNVTLSGTATISGGANGSGDLTILGSVTDINATLASLTYTGNTDVTGTAADTLTVTTNDQGNSGAGGAQQDSDTVQIDITAVNDAPVNTVPATVTADEETTTAIPGISITDVDDDGSDITVELEVTDGVLDLILSGGATVTAGANGSNELTLTGNLADINDTLASLTYTGNADVNGIAADTLTITTDDSGAGGTGGAQQDIDTVQIDITAVNDAPVNTVPATATTGEETATDIEGLSISDADAAGASLTTRLQVSHGVLDVILAGAATISAGANGSSDLTITGSANDINATLASLVYTGETDLSGPSVDTLTMTTNDLGNTGTGGALQDVDTVDISISGFNDAPVNTVPVSASVVEEVATAIGGISIADVDDQGADLTTQLQVSNGVLNVTLSGAATISAGANGTANLTIQGSKADINATLASLTYTGNVDVTGTEADSLTVTTDDLGNSGRGGPLNDVDTVKIDISEANDAPVNTVPVTATVVEESATAIAGLSIADTDDAGGNLTTRLQVSEGVLNVTLAGAATISAGANGSTDLTIQGSKIDINATLASVTYTGDTDVTGTAADTLTVTTDDQGNSGAGGAQQDTDTVQIDITAVNDAPVNTVPASVTADEETTTAIPGISVADVDDDGSDITVQLEVTAGVLDLVLSGGAMITAGANGSNELTLTGSLEDINDTLASLTYTGDSDVSGIAADTLTITTDDGGAGGTGGAQQDIDTVQIDITAMNDAPVNTVPVTATVVEETATAIAGISIADADDAGGNLTTRLQVSEGVLNVTLSGAATLSAGANGSADLTIQGSKADINATLASLAYTGNTDVTGTAADTLTITTNDLGNSGAGGAQEDVDTVQIDITDVNDAPVNTVPPGVTADEETTTAIPGISITDVDDDGSDVTVELEVTDGVLDLILTGSVTVTAGANGSDTVTITGNLDDINDTLASLTYTGNPNVNGIAADELTITTNDGNAGGQDIDTVQIDITAVNDAPVNTVPVTATVVEETATPIAGISIADADDAGDNLTTRLQVSEGVLNVTLAGAATISAGANGSDDLTILGSKVDINATLASLTYTGNTDATGAAADTLSITTDDQGNSGSGGALQSTDTVQIDITAVNDAPVNTVPASVTADEETTAAIPGISIADVDDDGSDITVHLEVTAGVLELILSGGATVTAGANGSDELTLTGSLDDINDTLASLSYTGNPDVNGIAADSLIITTDDGGAGGQDIDTVQIDITAVNDAPVNTVPVTATVVEETATAVAGISIADADDAGANLTTRLQVNEGVLNVSLAGAATISAGADGTADLTIQGSKADINATLASLNYTGNTDVAGSAADTLTITTNDLGNSGSGGAQEDVDTVQIDISGVNDAPVNTLPTRGTATEDTASAIPGVSIDDVDDLGADMLTQVRVSAGKVGVTLSGGATIVTGQNNSALLTIQGSKADINATLATLTYLGNIHVTGTGAAILTVTTGDLGNTGAGGDAYDIDTMPIDILEVNDAPENTVPATGTVEEETATTIPGISIVDVDAAGADVSTRLQVSNGLLNVTLSGAATISAGANGSGDLTILGSVTDINATLASLTYTGNTDVTGTAADTLTVTTNDQGNSGAGGAQQDSDTVQIDITAVNDAPVNTVPASVTADEETTTAIAGISIADVDDDGSDVTVQLEVTAGVLDLILSGGTTVTAGANGSNELTLTGSLADINDTLASLTYTGNADVNGIAADTLTITTDDGGAGGTGGAQQDIDTVQIDITAVNDAPVNTVPVTATVVEETATAVAGISIADADDAGGSLTTRLQVSEGVLNVTLSGAATILAGVNGSADLTIQGSKADINATLASLAYTGNIDVVGTAADTLTITTNDLGNSGNGGAQEDVDTVQIDITDVNDAPVNTVPPSVTVDEETTTAIPGISITDVDDDGSDVTVELEVTDGVLELILTGSVTVTAGENGSDTVTITGSLDDINDTLASLTYTGNPDVSGIAADTITITTDDGGTGGQDVDTIQLDITAVNDAPVNTVPATATVAEETSTAIAGISIADADDAGGNLTTRLQVSEGVLNVALSGAATISAGADDSTDLTLMGSKADINATLASLTYTGNTDVTGTAADTLTITTNDLGNSGTGGAQEDVDTVQIDITGVNDAPVNTVPPGVTVDEETTTAIPGISIADVDDDGSDVTVQLEVTDGVLDLILTGTVTVTAGANGSSGLTLTGSLDDINDTLASLTYTGNPDVNGIAADTLTITTDDGGAGGTGGAQHDIDTVQIDITAMNDAPVNMIPAIVTVAEEASTVLAGVSIADADDAGGNLTTRLQVTEGVLTVTLSGAATISAGANGSADLTILGSKADINATLASLAYTGNIDVVGTDADTLTITTNDLGNSGSGGALQDVDTVQIDITGVNDAPVNTVPPSVTVDEETTTAIPGISITDVDDDGSDVTVELEVTDGVLDLILTGSVTVTAGANGSDTVTITGSLDDINDTLASLTYTGNPDVNGIAADTITITTDDGGAGGQDVDTIQLDITAINDAPVNTVPVTATVAEETLTAISGVSIADADDAGGNLTTRLQVSEGVLNVTLSGAATLSAGTNGSADLTLMGSKADINATLASLSYTGNTDVTGTAADTLTVTTNDLGNSGNGGAQEDVDTVQIDITDVNDAPVNTVPPGVTVDEETTTAIPGISITDVDDDGSDVTVELEVTDGVLGLILTGSVTVTAGSNGSNTATITGNLDDINDTLASLTYTGNPDVNGIAADTITITTDDGGAGGQDVDTIQLDISATNNAPVNIVPVTATVAEETLTAIAGISIADADDAGGNLTTRLQVSEGVLHVTLSGAATISAGANGSADLTLLGSKADINATLASLAYTGNTDVTGTAADTLTITTNDLGNSGSGGALTDLDTVQIDIADVNDAPVVILPARGTATEDTVSAIPGVSIDDVDDLGADMLASVQVSAGKVGVTLSGAATIVYGQNNYAHLTIQGSKADINATLATLTYLGNIHHTGVAAATLTVHVGDLGNTGAGGDMYGTASMPIDILEVNDAPENTVPATITGAEETAFAITGVSIADPDAYGLTVSTRLQVLDGVLNLGLSGAATIVAGANGSGDLTLNGSVADINATLASLTYTGNIDVVGTAADTLTITTNDLGNSGAGGAQEDVDTVQINITVVNDAPVNTVPPTVTADEETTTAIPGISIADVDDDGSNVTVQLEVTDGVLDLILNGSVTVIAGANGSKTVTITGNLDDINDTLASLTYTGNPDVTGIAADTLTITTDDGGAGGTGGALQDIDTVQIDITAIDDAPTLGTNTGANVDEGGAVTITADMLRLDDVDTAAEDLVYTLVGTPGSGTILLDGVVLTDGQSFTQDDVNNGRISYLHNGDESMIDSIRFTYADGSSGALGGPASFGLTINPLSDNAPLFNTPASVSIPENTTAVTTVQASDADRPLQLMTYSIVDAGDASLFRIDPVTGELSFIAPPDYEVPLDADGDNVYELTVVASDGAGQSTQQNLTVIVDDVNERPSDLMPGAITVADDTAPGSLLATMSAQDQDQGDVLSYSLTGNESGLFVIDAATGELRLANGVSLATLQQDRLEVLVTVTDASGLTQDRLVVITIERIDLEQPGIVDPVMPPIPETGNPPDVPDDGSDDDDRTTDDSPALTNPGSVNDSVPEATPDISGDPFGAIPNLPGLGFVAEEGFAVLASVRNSVPITLIPFEQEVSFEWSLPSELIRPIQIGGSGFENVRVSVAFEPRSGDALDAGPSNWASLALDPVQLSSSMLALGALWWLTRAGGLISTILMGVPSWRHLDLLPIVSKPADDEPKTAENDDLFASKEGDGSELESRV